MPENADQDKQCNDWLLGVGPEYCSSVTTTPVEVLVLSATHLPPICLLLASASNMLGSSCRPLTHPIAPPPARPGPACQHGRMVHAFKFGHFPAVVGCSVYLILNSEDLLERRGCVRFC